MNLYRAGSGCLGVLLRVPRAARSSLTYAKRPGSPIRVDGYSSIERKAIPSQLQGGGVCWSEVKEEVRAQPEPGDMSGSRHPRPVASPADYVGTESFVFVGESFALTPYHRELKYSLTE